MLIISLNISYILVFIKLTGPVLYEAEWKSYMLVLWLSVGVPYALAKCAVRFGMEK
jgi:hypothetical protein